MEKIYDDHTKFMLRVQVSGCSKCSASKLEPILIALRRDTISLCAGEKMLSASSGANYIAIVAEGLGFDSRAG